MKFKLSKARDTMTPDLQRLQQVYRNLPDVALDAWVKNTPKDSGNARRKTKLEGNDIVANYPYAERLDKGYSKQARNGMSKPTLEAIERYLRQKVS